MIHTLKQKTIGRQNFEMHSRSFCIQFIDTCFIKEVFFCFGSRTGFSKNVIPSEIMCN